MSEKRPDPRAVAVPSGRLSRLARLGGLAGGIAGSVAAGGVRDIAAGRRPDFEALLLTPANAARMAGQLAQMRGAAMKVGQLLSMEAGEVLPAGFAEALSRLRSEADFMPSRQLKAVLERNWGKGFLSRFERFDVRPMAAASIGQVHRALTRDGRDLAIKVQYPGVRESIDSDVANVASLLRMSGLLPKGLAIDPLLAEARRQLHEEADYVAEARHLARFRDLLAGWDAFETPEPQPDLSTRDILAMRFVSGAPIESLAETDQAERDRVMGLLVDLLLRELFEFGLMQTDPNFANYRYDPESRRVVLLDFGATRAFEPAIIETYRRFLAAGLAGDGRALEQATLDMGYFAEDSEPRHKAAILRMVETGLEPLRAQGAFDFRGSDMLERMKEQGMAFAAERDFAVVPPIDTLFLQRKVAGLFLLGAKLGARVDARSRLERYL
ncbi:MAG: AarF/ABC1/UbiB kinase family protein [Pseudomonadota bacterium]